MGNRSAKPTLNGEGNGFSLIEVLIVMVILGITSALAAPNIGRWFEDYRLKTVARQLTSDLQFVRMKAVSEKVQYRVCFEGGNTRYRLEKGDSASASVVWAQVGISRSFSDAANPYYAEGVWIDDTFSGHSVAFSPTGFASQAGAAALTTVNLAKNVSVALTGRIRVE
jgi:prepilin-type N-terminal cleavage/methylation domain-containing protein